MSRSTSSDAEEPCFDIAAFLRLTRDLDARAGGGRHTELLRAAYVDAHNPNYRTTETELEYLASRVGKLQRLTKKICQQKIKQMAD